MNQVLFIISILLIFSFSYSAKVKIHILDPPKETAQDKIKAIQQNRSLRSSDSKFSQVCLNIYNTFSQMGPKSFNIYKGCEGKYELLGSQDSAIIKDRPLCYDYLNQFFCNYKIINLEEESKKKTTTDSNSINNPACGNDSLIELVLSIIKGCLTEDLNGATQHNYKCPGLDDMTFKIKNANDFCVHAEKKEMMAGSTDRAEDKWLVYSTIKESDRPNCEYITQLYNACIDSDNLLYPFSDYTRCFSKFNTMFFCNKLETFKPDERKLCSDFVLPTIGYKSLQFDLSKLDKDICDDFENTIINNHDNFIQSLNSHIGDDNKLINQIETILSKDKNLNDLSQHLLNTTMEVNKEWSHFYPNLVTNFKIRQNLTEVEFEQLSKLRNAFDEVFPYAATLSRLTNDQNFALANFTTMFDTIAAYYQRGEVYLDELSQSITSFDNIIEQNLNVTLGVNSNVMMTRTITSDEILSFQNEFVEILQYFKRFLNFVMNKIKSTYTEYTAKKNQVRTDITNTQDYIKKISNQKQNLLNVVLNQ